MIFLPLKQWPIGEKRLLLESKIYNLEVYIKRKSTKSFGSFNTSVDCFVLNIDKLDKTKSNNGPIIEFERINLLENIILSFYSKIIAYYDEHPNSQNLESQIDLKVDGLNLKFLKSGLFKSKGNVKDIIKVILSQLLAAHRSDQNLVIDKSLELYLTVTDLDIPLPKYKRLGTTIKNVQLSNLLQSSNFMATKSFFEDLKLGYVDLGQISRDFNKLNCLLLSIAFQHYMKRKMIDLITALDHFTTKGTKYYEEFVSYFNLQNVDKMKKWPLSGTVDYISKKIRRAIIVICSSKKLGYHHEIVFISKNRNNSQIRRYSPIYLLLSKSGKNNMHIKVAFEFKIKASSIFCQLCTKEISHKFHRCNLPMCRLCYRYMSKYSVELTSEKCRKLGVNDFNKKCEICLNVFTNKNCFETHLKRKGRGKVCLPFYKCPDCNLFINHNLKIIHKCNFKFCRICKISHHIKELCYISPNLNMSEKREKKYYFLKIAFSSDDKPIFGCFSTIKEDISQFDYTMFINKKLKKDLLISSLKQDRPIFCAQELFNYFEQIKLPYQSVLIFCEPQTFSYLLKHVDTTNSKLIFGKNGVSSFQIKLKKYSIKYKNIDTFLDVKSYELAYFVDSNMIFTKTPCLMTKEAIFNDQNLTINMHHFKLNSYIGSSKKIFDKLIKDKEKFKNIQDNCIDVFCQISLKAHDVYMRGIASLISLYRDIQTTSLCSRKKSFIFSHSTLSQAGNFIFRSVLPEKALPLIHHRKTSIKNNSSKFELLTCKLLKALHTITCKDERQFKSFVSSDGTQFQIHQFSADFFCAICSSMYFIEGAFKVESCDFGHKIDNKRTFFGKTKKELSKKSLRNRNELIALCNATVMPFVFNQCCLQSNTLCALKNHLIKHLTRFKVKNVQSITQNLLTQFKKSISLYSKEHYYKMDTSKCIDPALVQDITPFFNVHQSTPIKISKYDMNNSYGSQLHKLKLPFKDAGMIMLFEEANNFFNNMLSSYTDKCDVNGYARARVIPPNNVYTKICPFFAYECTKSNQSHLTLCKLCCVLKTPICDHTDDERSFYVTSTINSFLFAKYILNYKLDFTEIIIYKNCITYNQLDDAFRNISKLRVTNLFNKYFGKCLMLQGLGSFSINPDNYNNIKTVTNKNSLKCIIDEKNIDFKSFRFIGNIKNPHCVIETTNKQKKQQINNRTCNLIFSSCANMARIELYKMFMKCIDMKIRVLRLDADAISIAFHYSKQLSVDQIFRGKFKLENTGIKSVISFQKRSYAIINFDNEFNHLKCCGLSLTFEDRFSHLNFNELSNKFLTKKQLKPNRILAETIKYKNCYEYLASRPYGSMLK